MFFQLYFFLGLLLFLIVVLSPFLDPFSLAAEFLFPFAVAFTVHPDFETE